MIRSLPVAAAWAALMAASSAASAGQTVPPNAPGQYAPRDECAGVAGAGQFRAELGSAVRLRDSAALARLASADIKLDFGGGEGVAELRRRLDDPGGEELWQELQDLLDAGCAVENGLLFMPWFFAQDLGDADPYSVQLVAGTGIPFRSGPEADSGEIGRLSWQLVVPQGDPGTTGQLQLVAVIGDEQEGYVDPGRLRSPLDYRVVAERREGTWRLVSFIAGD